MENFAPVIIFAFNRPNHLSDLLNSLEKNDQAKFTYFYFFIDKYANESDSKNNLKVIEIAKKTWNFKSISICERDQHYGLKRNILEGVTEVINKYGKAIILEDDLVVSKYFLNYMNKSLIKYNESDSVWHINGFNYRIPYFSSKSSFFSTHMNCWGWATWDFRWNEVFNNLINNIQESQIEDFNFYNLIENNYRQIELNQQNKINTWAIFWYQTIFLNQGICLFPSKSLVINNGFDGSGVHSPNKKNLTKTINSNKINNFPKSFKISFIYTQFLKLYFWKVNKFNFIIYHLKKRNLI